MFSEETLREAAQTFFTALAANDSPSADDGVLSYFSNTAPVFVQHVHVSCPHPHTSRLCGLNAVRSYFDLLHTHWIRTQTALRPTATSTSSSSSSPPPDSTDLRVDTTKRSVALDASTTWKWRRSGRTWVEDFTLTVYFDESLRITRFEVVTVSSPDTCVLKAVDADPTDPPVGRRTPTGASTKRGMSPIAGDASSWKGSDSSRFGGASSIEWTRGVDTVFLV